MDSSYFKKKLSGFMFRQYVLIIGIISFVSVDTFGQTDADALRYSQTSLTGTARFSAMGGAFGALGGDFSSIATNPAALGIYRTSEFTLSSSIYSNSTTSSFLGNSTTEDRFNFNIPNLGFVFSNKSKNERSGWKGWNIGIGFNRINNFQSDTYYEGFNKQSSLLDNFVENANNNMSFDQFYDSLAYAAQLIYYDTNYNQFVIDKQPGQGVLQRRTGSTRGGMNDWNFSFASNYNDQLYLGASLGVKSIRYEDQSIYEESDRDNIIPYFRNFSFEQDVTTKGTGIDFKLGLVGRPADWIRIGAAVHTPTVYYMHDVYKNYLTATFDSVVESQPQESPQGDYNYRLTTPMKAIGSLAFILGKQGSIGAEYELIDYSSARFSADDFSFSNVNGLIRKKYTSTGNVRLGGEYKVGSISLRAGYAYYGSPFSDPAKIASSDFSKTNYTAGIGIRDENFFVDLGYVYSVSNEFFQPYTLSAENPLGPVPGVENKVVTNNFVITFGAKF